MAEGGSKAARRSRLPLRSHEDLTRPARPCASPRPTRAALPAEPHCPRAADHAPLPHPHLRRPERGRHRCRRAPGRMVQPHPRPRRRTVHRPAGPLRHHPGRGRPGQPGFRPGREAAVGMGRARRRPRAPPPDRNRERRHVDRAGRALRRRDRGAGPRSRTAPPGRRRAGLSRGDPAQVPLPRPAPRAAAQQHRAALPHHRQPAHPDEGPGLHRVPDPDPHGLLARGRPRLPRAVAHPPRQVLRAAAGTAAVQAAHHGGGLRSVFPDRAVLPRRGRPRRPLARRVLPARHRDEFSSRRTTSSTRSSPCCAASSRSSAAGAP